MARVTAQQVEQAQQAMLAAKSAKGTAKSGQKVDAYREAAERLTELRVAFRQQEEQAGRRVGYVSGDAAGSGQ